MSHQLIAQLKIVLASNSDGHLDFYECMVLRDTISHLEEQATNAKRFVWLMDNYAKIQPSTVEGPEHPGLHLEVDLWNEQKHLSAIQRIINYIDEKSKS